MKIRTKIEASHNDGIASQKNDIIIGELMSCNQNLISNNYDFTYRYYTEIGWSVNGLFSITEPEITQLYEAYKDLIPTGLSYTEQTKYLYYLGFMGEMAKTFKIQANQIEII
jgi:hypothetical protein